VVAVVLVLQLLFYVQCVATAKEGELMNLTWNLILIIFSSTMSITYLAHHNITPYHDDNYYRYKCPKCRTPFCCVQCSKDHKVNCCGPAPSSSSSASSSLKKEEDGDNNTAISGQDTSTTVHSKQQYTKKRKRRKDDNNDDDYDNEPGWNITSQMKELLHNSSWLQSTLQNDVGLRQLIHDIDGASDTDDDDDPDGPDTAETTTADGGGGGGQRYNNNNYKKRRKQDNEDDISPRIVALARAKYTHPQFASFIDKLLVTAGVLQQQHPQQQSTSSSSSSSVLMEEVRIDNGAIQGHLTLVPACRNIALSTATATNNDGLDDNEQDDDEQDDNESSSSSSDDDSNVAS
jgi:hypothetical protein